jgi:hypothetical protein
MTAAASRFPHDMQTQRLRLPQIALPHCAFKHRQWLVNIAYVLAGLTHTVCSLIVSIPGPDVVNLWQGCLPELPLHQLQHTWGADAACVAELVTQGWGGGDTPMLLDPTIQQLAALRGTNRRQRYTVKNIHFWF